MKQQQRMSAASSQVCWSDVVVTQPWLLVVDDDELAGRTVGRRATRITSLPVRVASTQRQAESWLATLPPPVAIVSDFDLPGEDNGVVFLQRLWARGIRCPAALFTGSPDVAAAELEKAPLGRFCVVIGKAGGEARLQAWMDSLRPPVLHR